MPTYQYSCTECGEQLEVVQSFSDPALTACPACQGKLRKVFNSVGIVFKGSGFYRNDSRNGATGGDKPATADKTNESSSAPAAAKSDSATTSTASTSSSSSSSSSSATSSSSSTAGAASS